VCPRSDEFQVPGGRVMMGRPYFSTCNKDGGTTENSGDGERGTGTILGGVKTVGGVVTA